MKIDEQLPPVAELLNKLDHFSRRIEDLLSAGDVDWHCCPHDDEWALNEVACHLRDVEREVHQPRFRALIDEAGAFLPGAVADDWVIERGYRQQDGPTAMRDFLQARRETIELLSDLDHEMWQRQGQHSFFGPTTMHELLYLVVQHDRAHWEQIIDLLAM